MKAMNVLLRADAGETQGTGHVMRNMTLAQALTDRGHAVTLMGNLGVVPWLKEHVEQSGVRHIACETDELEIERIAASEFDWVVVDSYSIPSEQISRLNEGTPCLAIVDGDLRGISADLYLDQNLGTTLAGNDELGDRLLAGAAFALIRNAVLEHRQSPEATSISGQPRVVAFMGGTDPSGAIVDVAESIAVQQLDIELKLVVSNGWAERVRSVVEELPDVRLIEPTMELPSILGDADVVVSAAGTSAWDLCAMARPSVLVAVVGNQQHSLAALREAGVALTIDAAPGGTGSLSQVGQLVASLAKDRELRRILSQRCWETFDGLGKDRVVARMERKYRA